MTFEEKKLALSRLSLRDDQPLEVLFDKLPSPPEKMLKLPGVAEWWAGMKLWDERRVTALRRIVSQRQPPP